MIFSNHKIILFFKPFIICVIVFIFAGLLFNTYETWLFCKYQDTTSLLTIFQSYFNIIAAFCLYALIVLPIYLLLGLLNKNLAQIFISLLFALFISLEIGLFVYYKQTGVLMGAELVVRPASEILVTIRNSSNLTLNTILITLVLSYFISLPFLLKKIKIFNHFRFLITGICSIIILSTLTLFEQKNENQIINNYLKSKSFYCFCEIKNYLFYGKKEYITYITKDKTLLKKYAEIYSYRMIPDLNYPMEHSVFEIPDVLSPYFNKSEKQPNIVIIIVESLGSYMMGEKGKNNSFTPFLDSLANLGLYWKNCLSLTPRTFGVVPSVIGSVPHGMRGFQFGIMPKHHSLFSILKNNDYATNFFYGGDANFDSMLDFLTAQETDHIDNFTPQLRDYQKKDMANYWALYDDVLFDRSLEYLKTLPSQKSKVNVYLTLTTHEPFYGGDKRLKEIYEPKAEKIFSKLDAEHKKNLLPVKDIIVPFTYLDDCMRDFIHNYSKLPDFENTIFIITGDHSYGFIKNKLAHYSVPLIIWSPLLKTHKIFPNIVSHFSITPSIIAFLKYNYNIKTPENLSWCSDGLDTASVFNSSEKFLFLSYERNANAMVYEHYYYQAFNKQLYKIDENLDLELMNDAQLIENIDAKFNTLKYVNNYVYHNDKIIKCNTPSNSAYTIIKGYENKNAIVCKTPDTIPSISGISTFDIMPVKKLKGRYNKIKIKMEADLVINDYVYQDQQMMLNFICNGENFENRSKENITKYIVTDQIECGVNYELSIEKEINVADIEKLSTHICVTTNEKDNNWKPDKKITISNVKVLIWGK